MDVGSSVTSVSLLPWAHAICLERQAFLCSGEKSQPTTLHSHEVSACLKIFGKNQSGKLPPSCKDRENSTLCLSRKLNKNQAVLTSPSICCACEYHSALEGRLRCWLEDSSGRWEFWLRSLSSVCFPSPCWLSSFSSENSYSIRV